MLEYAGQLVKLSDCDRPAGLSIIIKRGNAELLAESWCAIISPPLIPAMSSPPEIFIIRRQKWIKPFWIEQHS